MDLKKFCHFYYFYILYFQPPALLPQEVVSTDYHRTVPSMDSQDQRQFPWRNFLKRVPQSFLIMAQKAQQSNHQRHSKKICKVSSHDFLNDMALNSSTGFGRSSIAGLMGEEREIWSMPTINSTEMVVLMVLVVAQAVTETRVSFQGITLMGIPITSGISWFLSSY